MASLTPREDRSRMPDKAKPSSKSASSRCVCVALLLCAGPTLAPRPAQAFPIFFGGTHGMGGRFPSLGFGRGRMEGPISGPAKSWPVFDHARRFGPYRTWDGPRPTWDGPPHLGQPLRPFYPARDPESYPWSRHRRPIVNPLIDESERAPPPPAPRRHIVAPPDNIEPHIRKQTVAEKVAVVPRTLRKAAAQLAPAPAVPTRPDSGVPAADEHRYLPDEVLFELRPDVAPQTADRIAQRERLRQLAAQPLALMGTTMYRYRIVDKRSVATMVAALEADPRIAAVQPNYVYALQGERDGGFADAQYVIPEMHLTEAHAISNGAKTLVAVIDSGVDRNHPEISNAIKESFDADGAKGDPALHGTAVAGIIAADAELTGVAPQARLLVVRAFAATGSTAAARGTTYDIRLGIEWSELHGARVVNMSFAGPPDPAMSRELADGARRGVVFIASVGNEGGSAQPLYPAADANVIAVTATDRSDAVFKDANPCSVACVAAPGVDVLVAEPGDAYGFLSGTSMAAAHVSGVVALMLDANPTLEPKAIRDLLFKTAKHLNPGERNQESIAGVVDAYGALKAEISPEAENAIGVDATPVASSGKTVEGRSVGHQ